MRSIASSTFPKGTTLTSFAAPSRATCWLRRPSSCPAERRGAPPHGPSRKRRSPDRAGVRRVFARTCLGNHAFAGFAQGGLLLRPSPKSLLEGLGGFVRRTRTKRHRCSRAVCATAPYCALGRVGLVHDRRRLGCKHCESRPQRSGAHRANRLDFHGVHHGKKSRRTFQALCKENDPGSKFCAASFDKRSECSYESGRPHKCVSAAFASRFSR